LAYDAYAALGMENIIIDKFGTNRAACMTRREAKHLEKVAIVLFSHMGNLRYATEVLEYGVIDFYRKYGNIKHIIKMINVKKLRFKA
jgi:FixJ family two-component response regulator